MYISLWILRIFFFFFLVFQFYRVTCFRLTPKFQTKTKLWKISFFCEIVLNFESRDVGNMRNLERGGCFWQVFSLKLVLKTRECLSMEEYQSSEREGERFLQNRHPASIKRLWRICLKAFLLIHTATKGGKNNAMQIEIFMPC